MLYGCWEDAEFGEYNQILNDLERITGNELLDFFVLFILYYVGGLGFGTRKQVQRGKSSVEGAYTMQVRTIISIPIDSTSSYSFEHEAATMYHCFLLGFATRMTRSSASSSERKILVNQEK
ncbi:MAG: hypothetical protein ABSF09_00530 [Candidatus Bathyarchaeia archaeon]